MIFLISAANCIPEKLQISHRKNGLFIAFSSICTPQTIIFTRQVIITGQLSRSQVRAIMSRFDSYSREEQKAFINGFLGMIYDNYDTTRRIQSTVDGINRIVITILIILLLSATIALLFACIMGCRRYQHYTFQSLNRPKSEPIEI
uniref:Uncharacterized protein n=2 Tax=Onchocercidae TaxID=6296 RepID=A0A8L7SSL7_BRUMA